MAEDRNVKTGTGQHEERTLGDGIEESGENPAGASVGVGARGSGWGTAHMVGTILSPEDLPWSVGAISRRGAGMSSGVTRALWPSGKVNPSPAGPGSLRPTEIAKCEVSGTRSKRVLLSGEEPCPLSRGLCLYGLLSLGNPEEQDPAETG
ncbi:unnamed protein product [Lampetra planeri]